MLVWLEHVMFSMTVSAFPLNMDILDFERESDEFSVGIDGNAFLTEENRRLFLMALSISCNFHSTEIISNSSLGDLFR